MTRPEVRRKVHIRPRIKLVIDVLDPFDKPRKCLECYALMNFVNFDPFAAWPFCACLIVQRDFADQQGIRAFAVVVSDVYVESIVWDSEFGFSA